MKQFLKFSGLVAFVLALVAFILLLATNGVVFRYSNLISEAEGTTVLFGKTTHTALGDAVTKASPTALIGWILVILAMVILCVGVVMSLLKVKAAEKYAGLLNLVAVFALVVAGVLVFFTVLGFTGANKVDSDAVKYYHLGGGYVAAAILALLAGVVAALPVFLEKKK